MKNIPNFLSISRIFLGFTILFIYPVDSISYFNITVTIIGVASITDMLDGIIARKYNCTSFKGYILDGLGDRSFYVALILMIFMKFKSNIIIVWLFIFREILIYAFRLLNPKWRSFKRVRKISVIHALGIRLWIFCYLLADGFRYYFSVEISNSQIFLLIQHSIAGITIIIVYYGLYLYIKPELMEKE